MLCETSSVDLLPSTNSNRVLNEKKQLSFVYQPGIGLYDKKKINLDHQDLPVTITAEDVDRLIHESLSIDDNISTNQENQQKRKIDSNLFSSKKLRQSSKHSITPIIKSIPIVKKLSSENRKSDLTEVTKEQQVQSIVSQGLLLCPKEESIKTKKKKKIISTNTALLDDDDDDLVLDSILFNEIQTVQQQWQQFLILTMEKELHINSIDGKKKNKINKFHRSNEFLLAYENLYNFEGMKHWCPTLR